MQSSHSGEGRRVLRRLYALGLAVLAVAMASPAAPASATDLDFYQPPSKLICENGDVLRYEPAAANLAAGIPLAVPASVQRIMYCSRDANGKAVAVTGTVMTPTAPWIGPGQRPIVGYAHGTVGVGDDCAVSKKFEAGGDLELLAVQNYLGAGYGVVVTDYQGLGTPGMHQYLNRKAQGHAVLDAVRASQRLLQANLPDAGPVLLAGFSQGGMSSASAAELQPTYAPELDLRAEFAAGLPGDLVREVQYLEGTANDSILLYVLLGIDAASPNANVLNILNAAGRDHVAQAAVLCGPELAAGGSIASWSLTKDGRTISDHLLSDFRPLLEAQRLGNMRPGAPALIAQSEADEVVPYEAGRAVAVGWCQLAATVDFQKTIPSTHTNTAVDAYIRLSMPFFAARVLGLPAATNCGTY
jgi:Secretory lipase